MKPLLTLIQRGIRSLGREAKRDDGVVALVIAIALIAAAAALIATTARQNKEAEVARMSNNAKSVSLLKNSILAYFLTDPDGAGSAVRNGVIPCPDTDFPPDGLANGTTTCTANSGVVPYLSLGLSQDDVVDSYGNYFTYVVTGSSAARGVCTSIANSYDSTQSEYTGTIEDVTDTSVQPAAVSYYYAFISHGKNGLGAISASNTRRNGPSSANEIQNCPSNNSNCTDPSSLTIVSGPQDTTTSAYFDDSVYLSSRKQFAALCEGLTPAGKANAFINENFDSTTAGTLPSSLSSARSTANVQTATGSTSTDRALRFGGTSAAVRTATQFSPAERANYISFQWRPTALSSDNEIGFSLGLRATAADINNSVDDDEDIFNANTNDGITIRYYEDTPGPVGNTGAGDNTIYICDNTESQCDTNHNLAESGTFTLTLNQDYLVEAYDDGTQIWARITQVSTPANTATVAVSSIPAGQQDIAPSNSIFFINHSDSTSEIDDLVLGRGAMVASFDGTDDVISTAGDSHDTTTGNLTLEAAINPDTLPSGSSRATIMAKWTDGGANSVQSYRLSLIATGLVLEVAGDDSGAGSTIVTQTHNFGYRPSTGQWTHVAVTYNESNQTATLYVDGELSGTSVGTTFDGNGVNNGSARFSIGADRGAGIVNEFDGTIADVRVWQSVRTASEIFTNYNRRAPLTTGSASDLIVNWTLDRVTTAATLPTFSGTTVGATAASLAGADGTLSGASLVGALQTFFPPFSTTASFCATGGAGTGTVVNPYQCEFRNTAQSGSILIPNNLPFVHVKAWGGGGGGYDTLTRESAGGAGGFSESRLSTINGFTIAGALGLRVDVGGGGTGSGSTFNGAGGGGASGLWRDVDGSSTVTAGDFAGVVAGGGGGASYSDDNFGGGPSCNAAGDCGPGGGGGGPGNIGTLSNVLTIRAPDDGVDECGGRGGNNTPTGSPPPDSNTCSSGGAVPSVTVGGTGGGTAINGTSVLGAGGRGYDGSSTTYLSQTYGIIGAGGGGGGVSITGMTAGGGQAGGYGYDNLDLIADIVDLVTFILGSSGDSGAGGFGGGGGAGFVDSGALNLNPYGIRGGAPTPGITTTDPDYAPTYCSSGGSPCPTNVGIGGTPNGGGTSSTASGQRGAVIIKW